MNAAAFQMTSRQQLVHSSLARKKQDIADLYECALRVFNDDANPGRLFLAAHAIREMIDGHRSFAVAQDSRHKSLFAIYRLKNYFS